MKKKIKKSVNVQNSEIKNENEQKKKNLDASNKKLNTMYE